MSLPIGETPTLKGSDALKFLLRMKHYENIKVGPVPTPKLYMVHEMLEKIKEEKMKDRFFIGYIEEKPHGEVFGWSGTDLFEQVRKLSGYDTIDGPFDSEEEAEKILVDN